MFNNNNAVNEVAELISEFQSRLDKIKSKYNIVDVMPQPEHQAIQEPVIKPLHRNLSRLIIISDF